MKKIVFKFKVDDGHSKSEESHDHGKSGNTSCFQASLQISNTIIGAGILSFPMVMNNLGIIYGTIFVLVVAYCTIFSVKMLLICKDITGHKYPFA